MADIHIYPYELAMRMCSADTRTILDYGCGSGSFLAWIAHKREFLKVCGIEVNPELMAAAKASGVPAHFVRIEPGQEVPLEDNSFDYVTILDVLEHTGDEGFVLGEIYRLLRPSGVLVITVPHKGLTAWADRSNLKFNFPRLHRTLYKFLKNCSAEEYSKRFLDTSTSLIGNITRSESPFHKHYTKGEICRILGEEWRVEAIHYYGVLLPLLEISALVLERLIPRYRQAIARIIERILHLDYSLRAGPLSYHILIKATSLKTSPRRGS